jgi:Arc/MetJ family transcription regulator
VYPIVKPQDIRWEAQVSKTCINIDDELLAAAKRYTGKKTITAVVEEGLQSLVRKGKLAEVAAMEGSGTSLTQETLEKMREDG